MNLLFLDGELYSPTNDDYANFNHAVGNCCGSCNEYSLQDLREQCLHIKANYTPLPCDGPHETPPDQNIKEPESNDLPF